MRRSVLLFITLLLLQLFISCAAQFPLIASVAQSEMLDLQSLCTQQKITLSEKTAGDSLAAAGARLLDKNKREAAYALFDRAAAYYRIALTKNSISSTEKKIATEEQALAKTREDVAAYHHVLKELKSMEQQ